MTKPIARDPIYRKRAFGADIMPVLAQCQRSNLQILE